MLKGKDKPDLSENLQKAIVFMPPVIEEVWY